jgi:hypothetical protein
VQEFCADVLDDDMALSTCAQANCISFIIMPGAIAQAENFTPVITECADICAAAPEGDGGTEDAGQ